MPKDNKKHKKPVKVEPPKRTRKPVRRVSPRDLPLPDRVERLQQYLPQLAQPVPAPQLAEPLSSIALVEPDPLHPSKLSLLFIAAASRVLAFAQQYPQEVQAEPFIRAILARVLLKDPKVKLLLAIDQSTGEVLGHVLGTIEGNGTDTWLFCHQAKIDPNHSGILRQMIEYGSQWAKTQGATSILMATQLDPAFWQERYGFESVRHVMRRPL